MFREWEAIMRFCGPALALLFGLSSATVRAAEIPVDLELVLAVDVSLSMDVDEQTVQRDGYLKALVDPVVLGAIAQGVHQRIAVAYVEWAGSTDQQLTVNWRLIEGRDSAEAFAAELASKPLVRWRRTSVSGGLLFAAPLFDNNGFGGERRVIDISGDGANNQGPPVLEAREQVLTRGITINGLPLMLKRGSPYSVFEVEHLDQFYEDCVIGGPGAFMIPVRSVDEFREAIRTKLILEIAGYAPARPLVHFAQARQPVPCDIGERQWRDWMRDGYQ
jgi:Protein of unknown function (DUF1194)